MDTVSRLRAVVPFVVLAVVWGFSFPAISVGLRDLPPVLFAAFRYDVAAVLLLGYAAVASTDAHPGGRADYEAIVGGGCFLVAGNAFLFVGLQTVPSGVAAIIQGLVPIATTLWALGLLPEERVSAVGAAGILLGFVGVGLVVRPDPSNLLAGDTLGRGLIVVQVISVSLGGVLVQRADPSMRRVPLVGWAMTLGAVLLHLASTAVGEPLAVAVGLEPLAAVLYLGAFATALAFFIYFTLLERHGALETSLVAYAVPVVATIAGIVFLDEQLQPLTLVGFLVVFAGFVLLKRDALRDLLA
jgi:drug/metabolite transporter (DMT)-like permease